MTARPVDVFIVDDDALLCFILKKQFETFDEIRVWGTSSDGEEALAALDNSINSGSSVPNLILLDINMPRMNGWQFLNTFEQNPALMNAGIMICILSSSIDDGDMNKAKNYPSVNRFISKPLLNADITELIRQFKKESHL